MHNTASPDPVSDPKAYQDLLVGLVGDDDPAEVQAETPRLVRELLADAGADAERRPEAEEWSVSECLAHMLDAELVVSGRYRWILAHDQPELIGYDQDLWVIGSISRSRIPASCWRRSRASVAPTWRCGLEPRSSSAIGSASIASAGRRATG